MTRTVKEWVGKSDDTPVPPRVRLRVFDAKGGLCHMCRRRIMPGEEWTCEHVIAIVNLGPNRESNLDLTCCNCLPEKNAADVAEKSAVAGKRRAFLGIRRDRPGPRVRVKMNGRRIVCVQGHDRCYMGADEDCPYCEWR